MESRKIILIFAALAVVALLIGAAVAFNLARTGNTPGQNNAPGTQPTTRQDPPSNVTIPSATSTDVPANVAKPTAVAPAGTNQPNASARTFSISVAANKFSPDTVIGKVGDRIHITFTAVDKDYDFTQPDYGFKVPLLKGQPKIVEFQAAADGKFTFYCESCGGPSKGPVGYIIVAPK